MVMSATVEGIRRKFELLRPVMNERVRRQWAAAETLSLGWGGVTAVAEATGLSRTTTGTTLWSTIMVRGRCPGFGRRWWIWPSAVG